MEIPLHSGGHLSELTVHGARGPIVVSTVHEPLQGQSSLVLW